jgi:uncharacterized RDD family membrane protein YckC
VEYGSVWRRLAAYLLDGLLCLVAMALISLPVTVLLRLPSIGGLPTDARQGLFVMKVFLAFAVITKLVAWLYYTMSESSEWQGTPGKVAVGLVVTDLDGNRISFKQANKRYWAKIASDFLYLGYVSILLTEKRQALHGYLAKTLVVRR